MYRVGVDLGGTNIRSGVVDDQFKIIGVGELKTNAPRPAAEIFDDITKTVHMAVEAAGLTMDDISSVGVGTPGTVIKRPVISNFQITWISKRPCAGNAA